MSSMLEQAIVDATALREAALKNAEQAIIEKYAPQIKEAVESLLEDDNAGGIRVGSYVRHLESNQIGQVHAIDEDGVQVEGRDGKTFLAEMEQLEEAEMLHEEDMGIASVASSADVGAPMAAAPQSVVDPNAQVDMSMEFEFDASEFNIDLNQVKAEVASDPMSSGEEQESTEDLLSDLTTGEDMLDDEVSLQEMINMVQEILNEDAPEEEDDEPVVEEEEVIEEELTVDLQQVKHGWNTTVDSARGYDQDMSLAQMEDTKWKEENEALVKKVAELKESLEQTTSDAHKLLGVVEQLKSKLDETLVSNARLVYSNKTLSDASLNERQKNKIVEAIALANSTEEAKTLHETLTATVGSNTNDGPKSLSESVNRRSNLSAIMPRRKENVVTESMSFADRMKKLAGIN
jgi:Txe/YoeB family toxin of Txe-Axe toxin-antitoxin module